MQKWIGNERRKRRKRNFKPQEDTNSSVTPPVKQMASGYSMSAAQLLQ